MTEIEKAILLLVANGYAVFRASGAAPEHAGPAMSGNQTSTGKSTYTVPQFCDAHNISRTHFYQLIREGKAPRLMKVGRRTMIGQEAVAEWVAAMGGDGAALAKLPTRSRTDQRPALRPREGASARDEQIINQFNHGHTRAQIAAALGLTEQRVGQILRTNAAGVSGDAA